MFENRENFEHFSFRILQKLYERYVSAVEQMPTSKKDLILVLKARVEVLSGSLSTPKKSRIHIRIATPDVDQDNSAIVEEARHAFQHGKALTCFKKDILEKIYAEYVDNGYRRVDEKRKTKTVLLEELQSKQVRQSSCYTCQSLICSHHENRI